MKAPARRPRRERATGVAFVAWANALSSLVAPATARAAEEPAAEADQLFSSAKALMEAGDVAGACRDFQRSFVLAPRAGTALNLGLCLERDHRFLAAYRVLLQASDLIAKGPFREERDRLLREHKSALEARLCRLRFRAPASPDVTVKLDGEPLGPNLEEEVLVEASPHLVSLAAPGKKPLELAISDLHDGEIREISLPALAPTSEAATATDLARSPLVAAPAPAQLTAKAEAVSPVRQRRLWYWVAGGAVVTALILGGYVLLRSDPSPRKPDVQTSFP